MADYSLPIDSDSGTLNVSQTVVAALLEGLKSMNLKKSAAMGGSVGLSTFIKSSIYNPSGNNSAINEKYVVEPIVAGALYALFNNLMLKKEGKNAIFKNFLEGLTVCEASAVLNVALLNMNGRIPGLSNYDQLRSNADASSYVKG